ncbi:MAG TPA: hypothetical protein VII96_11300 [Acidimicrobiales bacterium]
MNNHDDGSTPANETDPFSTSSKRRRGVRVTYAAAVALGLAVGGGAIAGAATGSSSSTTPPASHADGPGGHMGFGGTPPTAFGTVASVGTNTFTLTTHDGAKVTVDVSGTTTYVDHAVTTPSIADVKVGDHVAVFGTEASNTVAATKVAIAGAGGPGDGDGPGGHMGFGGTPPAAVGTVASVGTNIFTLTTPDGTKVTVDVGSSTSFMEFGKTAASIADVTVGAHVAVFGTDTNNTVTATQVGIGGPGGSGGPGGTHGPGGPGGWAPSWSRGTSSSGSSSSSTTSSGSSSGSTLA